MDKILIALIVVGIYLVLIDLIKIVVTIYRKFKK